MVPRIIPVPVLKMVGVYESIRDNDRDYDQAIWTVSIITMSYVT